MTRSREQFTPDIREWHAWLKPVELSDANSEQQAALEEAGPILKHSEFARLLVHEVSSMRERNRLLKLIMYGAGGLSRAERELASTAESLLVGCAYCYSVHARFYIQLTKEPETIAALHARGSGAALHARGSGAALHAVGNGALLNARQRAIVDFAMRLAAAPPLADASDVAALRSAGLTDLEILDLVHVVAIFAWATRVLLTLGSSEVTTRSAQ